VKRGFGPWESTTSGLSCCFCCAGWLRRLRGTEIAAVAKCLCGSLLVAWPEGEGAEESELACMLAAASELLP